MSDAFTQAYLADSGDRSVASCGESGARTLRRRRSAASAALLSRPSMLTLGELVPSFETCVLVYTSSCSKAAPELIYALFEPNFLICGANQIVRKLDRASWERLRSHVEELRIVALSPGFTRHPDLPPRGSQSPCKPACVFDLSTPTDSPSQRSVSRIYLQPASYTSVPARSRDELLRIEIHAPSDAGVAGQRMLRLPAQLKEVVHDAEQLTSDVEAVSLPRSAPPFGEERRLDGKGAQVEFEAARARILQLVQWSRADS